MDTKISIIAHGLSYLCLRYIFVLLLLSIADEQDLGIPEVVRETIDIIIITHKW